MHSRDMVCSLVGKDGRIDVGAEEGSKWLELDQLVDLVLQLKSMCL